jgi:hypothetical protein
MLNQPLLNQPLLNQASRRDPKPRLISLASCEIVAAKVAEAAEPHSPMDDSPEVVKDLIRSFEGRGLMKGEGELLIPAFAPQDRFVFVAFRRNGEKFVLQVWLEPEESGRLAPVPPRGTAQMWEKIKARVAYRVPLSLQ